jgi:hypothetical protein
MTLLLDEPVLEICWSSVLACAHSAKPVAQLVGALQGRILVSIRDTNYVSMRKTRTWISAGLRGPLQGCSDEALGGWEAMS